MEKSSLCARWPWLMSWLQNLEKLPSLPRVWKWLLIIFINQGLHDGLFLGDSGYLLTRHLMTLYLKPSMPSEENFNVSFCQTRVIYLADFCNHERRFQAFQVWFRVSPDQGVQYNTACVILHDLGNEKGDIFIQQDCTDKM